MSSSLFLHLTIYVLITSYVINISSQDKLESIKDLREKWLNTTKQLKEKIIQIYKQKTFFPHESVSIGPKPSSPMDYPGNDTKKLKIIQETWEQYYKCLVEKHQAIGQDRSLTPLVVPRMIGDNVELDCNLCISPQDIHLTADWYFKSTTTSSVEKLLEESEYIQISPYDYTLNIFNMNMKHAGTYVCKLGDTRDAPYFLQMIDDKELITKVKPSTAKKGPSAQDPILITMANYVLWNDWMQWSTCSWCGLVGRRSRTGYCKITLAENAPTDLVPVKDYSKYPALTEKIINKTNTLLSIFDYGIACRSPLLPKELRNIDFIRNYNTQVMEGFCKVPCEGSVIVDVLDKDGKVVQTVNNTAGEYSVLQEAPGIPPVAQRVNIYAHVNSSVTLTCPGNLYTNAPIEWTVSGKVLTSENLEAASMGRIQINSMNQIKFKYTSDIDSKIYTCWQQKEIAGVIQLLIIKEVKYDTKKALKIVTFYMSIPLACTLLYTLINIILDHKKALNVK